jgi:F-type H+-transporting ATPase subunit b
MDVYPDKTILFQFCQILVLLVVLHFLVFKPFLKALTKRQQAVQSLAEKADGSKQGVEDLSNAYEETLKKKREPILQERENLLKQAHSASMQVIEEARRDLTTELARVKETVTKEAGKTFETLVARSEGLAGEIVTKIMQRGA